MLNHNLRDLALSRMMMEEATKLQFQQASGFALLDVAQRASVPAPHEEEAARCKALENGDDEKQARAPKSPVATEWTDGTMTAEQRKKADAVDPWAIAEMHVDDISKLLQRCDEDVFQKHVDAAKCHELFSEHKQWVKETLIGLNNPEDVEAWVFCDHEFGDPLEDMVTWYEWLSQRRNGLADHTEAGPARMRTVACLKVAPIPHRLLIGAHGSEVHQSRTRALEFGVRPVRAAKRMILVVQPSPSPRPGI